MSADPAGAAATIGVTLTEEEVAALRASDLSTMAEGLDERLSKDGLLFQASRSFRLVRRAEGFCVPAGQTVAWATIASSPSRAPGN